MQKPGWLPLLGLLTLLWVAAGAQAQEITIAPGAPIVVGVMTASYEGTATFGVASEHGVILAHEERASLRIGDAVFAIALDHYDTACDDATAAAAATNLVQEDRAVGVIGPNCSNPCLAVAPLFDEASFTSLSPSCSGPSLTEHGFRSFLRLANPNDRIAAPAIRYVKQATGIERLAILRQGDDPYYSGLGDAAAAEFAALGGEIVVDRTLSDDLDPALFLAEAQNAEADAIFCACHYDPATTLLELMAEQPLVFIGESHDWAAPLVARLGSAADGVYFSSDYPLVFPATRELAARYAEKFGARPLSPYFATGYDAYQLLLDAVAQVAALDDDGALHIDRAALNEALRSTRDVAGVSGQISCGENGECLTMPTAVLQIRDGKRFLLSVDIPEDLLYLLPDYGNLSCGNIRDEHQDGDFTSEHPAYTENRDRDQDGLACELDHGWE
ncbi:MAG: branched-chain amino acid ABC transporter substrate-binding protein [Anaerolineaceae bacterium]|nr:branched-chain amino acid ABC transporter substrate-binding protein [Anaerolineaceae bacterium]